MKDPRVGVQVYARNQARSETLDMSITLVHSIPYYGWEPVPGMIFVVVCLRPWDNGYGLVGDCQCPYRLSRPATRWANSLWCGGVCSHPLPFSLRSRPLQSPTLSVYRPQICPNQPIPNRTKSRPYSRIMTVGYATCFMYVLLNRDNDSQRIINERTMAEVNATLITHFRITLY